MNEELKHYGVKGMKWGVRTSVYTKNRIGEKLTDRQKKKMSQRAVKVLKKNKKEYDTTAKSLDKASTRQYKKIDKLVWTSEHAQAKGDQQKFEKYQAKAWKQTGKFAKTMSKAEHFTKLSEVCNQQINDISSGKLKAGRDFVTNSTYSTNILLDAAGLINVRSEHNIDFK